MADRAAGRVRDLAARVCPSDARVRHAVRRHGSAACSSRARSLREPTCCCSTSRPIISTSTRSCGWRAFLADYAGALVFVTHDRAFLERLATRIVELDRGPADVVAGRLRDVRSEEAGVARDRSGQPTRSSTSGWRRRKYGCARASRRDGRATRVVCARSWPCERNARPGARRPGNVRLQVDRAARSGQMVFEADRVSKEFGRPRWSASSRRASCGATASGSSDRMARARRRCCACCWERPRPTAARCAAAPTWRSCYYDQQREQLDPERTVFDTVGEGNDTVTVAGGHPARLRLPRGFSVPTRARQFAGEGALGRRAQPVAAGASVHAARERPRARRTDQRSRYRDARAARSAARDCPGTILLVSHDRRVSEQRRDEHVRLRGRWPDRRVPRWP